MRFPCAPREPPRAIAISILELIQGSLSASARSAARFIPHQNRRLRGDERRLRMVALNVNGQTHQVDVDPDTPLLWVMRDAIGLTGTTYGCGNAQCGCVAMHLR